MRVLILTASTAPCSACPALAGMWKRQVRLQDYLKLHVRYWYLAGDKQAATLWQHKWNMFTNKFFRGIDGPNFSYRVTLKQGSAESEPEDLVNSFTDDMLQEVQAIVDTKYKEVAQEE